MKEFVHLPAGDEFLSKRHAKQRTTTLTGAALLRAKDLWRLLPSNGELPHGLSHALRDLPSHLSARLLQLLVDHVDIANKSRMAPLILALITSNTTDFRVPTSVSRDFALSRELIMKLMQCSLTSLDLSAQMELKASRCMIN